jgi:hypothetical protein
MGQEEPRDLPRQAAPLIADRLRASCKRCVHSGALFKPQVFRNAPSACGHCTNVMIGGSCAGQGYALASTDLVCVLGSAFACRSLANCPDVLTLAVRHGCILISADMVWPDSGPSPGTGTEPVTFVVLFPTRSLPARVRCQSGCKQIYDW